MAIAIGQKHTGHGNRDMQYVCVQDSGRQQRRSRKRREEEAVIGLPYLKEEEEERESA